MSPSDVPINWKRNLTVTWLGCFLTGAAFSLVMPFLPLYVEQLGVTGHSALNMWSGLVFSITFLFSAIASPFWGGLADRKGRKIMLLRSALGMAIVMLLMGMAQNIWQFLILRALLGLLGGFIPNANALIATQVPRHKSGWALGTLSTGGVSGALLGPLAGGLLADHYGLRPVFFITASVLFICFLLTFFFIRENFLPVSKKEMLHVREVVASLKNPRLVLSLFVTTLIIQVATGSIAPILTLYVRELAGNVSNIAFISGMIASVPGVAALLSAPPARQAWRQNWPGKDPYRRADYFRTAADSNVFCANAMAARAIAVSAWRGGWRAAASRSNSAGLQLYQPDSRAHIQLQPIFPRYRQRHRPSHGRRNFRELWLPRRILRHGRRGVVQCHLFMEQLTTAQTGNRMIFALSYLQYHRISYSFPKYLVKSKGDTDDHVCHAGRSYRCSPGRISG